MSNVKKKNTYVPVRLDDETLAKLDFLVKVEGSDSIGKVSRADVIRLAISELYKSTMNGTD